MLSFFCSSGDYAGLFIGSRLANRWRSALVFAGIFTKIANCADLMKIVFKIKEDDAATGVIATAG